MSIAWGARIDAETYRESGWTDAPWDSRTWDRFESNAGKRVGILHWGQEWGKFDPTAAAKVHGRGATSLISYNLPVDAIMAGTETDRMTAMARAWGSFGRPLLIRPGWEMNGSWFKDWGRKASYPEAWRKLRRIAADVAPNAKFVWAPNIGGGTASVDWPEPYWPGAAHVDYHGIDGYNRNEPWVTPYEMLAPTYKRLLNIADKKIIVCETGSTEAGGSKPAWIANLLSNALPKRFPKIAGLVWFNWPIVEGGKTRDWPIESSAASTAAFKKGIASSYYLAGAPPAWL